MKKVLLVTILILTMVLSCSCVEEISEESVPGLGPMQSATAPTTPEPVPSIDPDTIPDTTDTTDPDAPDGGDDEPIGDTSDLVFTEIDSAETVELSGYITNDPYSTDGDVVNKYVSGSTTVYEVCYGRTITFIVEVTEQADSIRVDTYLEHYRLFMGNEKIVNVTIGDYSGKADIPELEWDKNEAAKSKLSTAVAPKGDSDTVEIKVDIPFGGKYHGETIENLSFSVDHKLN